MREILNEKILFYLSVTIGVYFILLSLDAYVLKSGNILVGIIRESLTIPMLILQIILLVLAITYCIQDRFRINEYSFWAFSILIISNLLTLGSILKAILN
jgi:hypothetical protein